VATAARLDAAVAARFLHDSAARFARAVAGARNAEAMSSLIEGLRPFVPYLTPADAEKTARAIQRALAGDLRTSALWRLPQGLAMLLPRLEPGLAAQLRAEAIALLTQTLDRNSDPVVVANAAEGVAVLAPFLPPPEAARLLESSASAVTRAMDNTKEALVLYTISTALVAVIVRMEAQQAVRPATEAAVIFLDVLARTKDTESARCMLTALAEVAGYLPCGDAAFVTAVLNNGRAGTSFPLYTDQWSRAVEAQVFRFGPRELAGLLKQPLCAGEPRRQILDRLEKHFGRKFVDRWDFVRFAREQNLDLDLAGPPQRLTARQFRERPRRTDE
jgi:hypothetical protein